MIDVSKVFLAQTPDEVFAITQTSNFVDAERVAIEAYNQSYRTIKSLISRSIIACIGLLCLYFTLVVPPLFIFSFFFFILAFFGRILGKKQLRRKIAELQTLVKKLEDYPELLVGRSFANSFPKSIFGSRAASINDIGNLFINTDKSKHMWNSAGFCSVDTGKRSDNRTIWQSYYVFVYPFQGSVPQMLLLNKQDQFLPTTSPNNTILTDSSSPWHCIVPDGYEIEALAIFTEDTVSKLAEKSTHEPVCSFEFFNSSLLCFLPTHSPDVDVKGLFAYEKTADSFADILLPQLEKATMATIGNISPVLSVDLNEEDIQHNELSQDEKKRYKWILVVVVSMFIAVPAASYVSYKGVVPHEIVLLIIIIFTFLVALLMPKHLRKQLIEGFRLRVNGRTVKIYKERE